MYIQVNNSPAQKLDFLINQQLLKLEQRKADLKKLCEISERAKKVLKKVL